MQTLVINASPFGRRGNTATVLSPFLDGMREAGGSIEIVPLDKLSIKPCRGDLSCWFKTGNVCVQQDDMVQLLPKFHDADIVVFSTPVYCDGVPGQLKIMMDRLVVMGIPFLEVRDGHSRHPLPPHEKMRKFVLVASCGLWEKDNFTPMVAHLQAFCRNTGYRFGGALLRPHSFAMKNRNINDILRAAKSAGREIFKNDTISPALQDAVSRIIVSREDYLESVNRKTSPYFT
ncbi:MAG: flavodoxin family protein [Chitinispirillaceae bacterium]|nr:flavodoxin family protein [Chitinispirillaceae bacterium]